MKVTKNNILVEEIKLEEKVRASGLIVPVTTNENDEKTRQVSVVQVADNITNINIGNTLVVNKYAGVRVKLHDKEYQVITESDVLIIL